MPLDLLKRGESPDPLTSEQHDENFTAIETEVNAKANTADLGDLAVLDEIAAAHVPANELTLDKLVQLDANVVLGSAAGGNVSALTATALGRNVLAAADAAALRTLAGAEKLTGQRTITAAAATLVLTDESLFIVCNRATAQTITIPANATVAFPTNTKLYIYQLGAGAVTIAGAGGVTLEKPADLTLTLRDQFYVATCFKRDTDTWVVMSGLASAV